MAETSWPRRLPSLPALQAFVRIPSVSAQPRHAADVRRCATWLAGYLRRIGLEHVAVAPTAGQPVVYADWLHAPARPTVLLYGHYDVQPPDPLRAWRVPPFAGVVAGSHLYGRGATDDKGQIFAHLAAIEELLRTTGRLPVNIRCLFEGEEEIGSPNLKPFLLRHRDRLQSDIAVISDTRMLGADRPALTYALRGGVGFELEVAGPAQDLHSGNFGGAVHNPLQALSELLAGLHDTRGRIAVPGVYDRVRRWDREERAYMASAGPSDERVLHDAGVALGWGEAGYSAYERTTIRPALTINGIAGGYAGDGGQSVIPARAKAKFSLRLVPDQDPDEIARLVSRYVARNAPPTARATLRVTHRSRPALIDRGHPAMRAAARAYARGFGRAPALLRSGGSIPVVQMLQETLGLPTVLLGFALPDAGIHAPNERLHLPTQVRAIATCAAFFQEAALIPPGRAPWDRPIASRGESRRSPYQGVRTPAGGAAFIAKRAP